MNRRDFVRAVAVTGVAGVMGLALPRRLQSTTISGGSLSGGSIGGAAGGGGGGEGLIDLSVIPSTHNNATLWNPGIYGGIPPDDANASTFPNGVGPATVDDTLTWSSGDRTSEINTALSTAGAAASKTNRRIVVLGAGTWAVSDTINIPDYVILRGTINGDGFTRDTTIDTSSSQNFVTMGSGTRPGGWNGTIYEVQGTLKPGDATITLDTVTGLSVGDLIKLDQPLDAKDANGEIGTPAPMTWATESFQGEDQYIADTTNVTSDWDAAPTSTEAAVFHNSSLWHFLRCDLAQVATCNSSAHPDSNPHDGGNTGWRPISQTFEILAIDGGTDTITVYQEPTTYAQDGLDADICGSPVRMWYYDVGTRPPEVYRCAGGNGESGEYAGLEDIRFELSQKTMSIGNAKFCWLKNVETDGEAGGTTRTRHISLIDTSYRCEIKSCFVHGQSSYESGGAYGINISGSEHYIHDCVVYNHNKPINFECSNGGNVAAYNFVDNAIINSPLGWQESGIGTHASFCHNELAEGNYTPNVTADSTHGNNGFLVAYRNHLRGRNLLGSKAPVSHQGSPTGSLRRAFMSDFVNWEMSSIGNVCYDDGAQAGNVLATGASPPTHRWWNLTSGSHYIYVCGFNGWSDVKDTDGLQFDDGFAEARLHRHLDYHYLTSGNTLYTNPGNSETTLQDSLHRTTAPDYFSGYTWPPIDSQAATHALRVTGLPAEDRSDAGEA